jgi:hypothetical protein
LLLVVAATTLLVGYGRGGDVSVKDVWVRSSPLIERAGAAYMIVENAGSAEDRLLSASVDFANKVELHETKKVGDMMKMLPVEAIPIPAKGSVELKPGGLHVMLMGLTRELKAGEKATITLKFEKAGEINVAADVRDQ